MTNLSFVVVDFEGPLDLLWHLIRTNKYDIFDIPIATITDQFMSYLHGRQQLELDVAGEYIVMAASLMALKSRLLLPTEKVLEDDDEALLDPRDDLVSQLLAYEAYQNAAQNLSELATDRQQYFAKPASINPKDEVIPLAKGLLSPNDIYLALQRVLKQKAASAPIKRTVEAEEVTIADQSERLLATLRDGDMKGLLFEAFFKVSDSVEVIITSFLALLELMKTGQIHCIQADYLSPIRIQLREQEA